jgi:hypothetical protein
MNFDKPFGEIMSNDKRTPQEEELVKKYKWHSYFLDNNSVVNRISRYMRTSLALIGRYSRKAASDFDYTILQTKEFNVQPEKLEKMKGFLKEYKEFKKDLRNKVEGQYATIEAYVEALRKKALDISTNDCELADYAVEITYNGEKTMVEFPWRMFPDGILENIINNTDQKIIFPVEDEHGTISYLWNKYTMKEFSLEELYNED